MCRWQAVVYSSPGPAVSCNLRAAKDPALRGGAAAEGRQRRFLAARPQRGWSQCSLPAAAPSYLHLPPAAPSFPQLPPATPSYLQWQQCLYLPAAGAVWSVRRRHFPHWMSPLPRPLLPPRRSPSVPVAPPPLRLPLLLPRPKAAVVPTELKRGTTQQTAEATTAPPPTPAAAAAKAMEAAGTTPLSSPRRSRSQPPPVARHPTQVLEAAAPLLSWGAMPRGTSAQQQP